MMLLKYVPRVTSVAVLLTGFSPRFVAADASFPVDDAQVTAAFNAVGVAETYGEVLTALNQHAPVLGSARAVELADQALQTPGITAEQQVLILNARQIALEVGQFGAPVARQLLAVRLIAAAAFRAGSPAELAEFMDSRFAALAGGLEPSVVRTALQAPADLWPPALLPLMEQLAEDWPIYGALAAATRMAAATNPDNPSQKPTPPSFEDKAAGAFMGAGRPIPDGLIINPQY